jgi:GGDEF domain-containing protein
MEELASFHRHNYVFSLYFRIRELEQIHQKAGHMVGQETAKELCRGAEAPLEGHRFCFRYIFNYYAILPDTNLDRRARPAATLKTAGKNKIKEILKESSLECSSCRVCRG